MFRLVRAASGGTTISSGYKGYSGYFYQTRTSFAPNNEANTTFIPVVHGAWNSSTYRWNGYLDLTLACHTNNQYQVWVYHVVTHENNSNYWSSHQLELYNKGQLYIDAADSLSAIEVDANGSSSGQTLNGTARIQYSI